MNPIAPTGRPMPIPAIRYRRGVTAIIEDAEGRDQEISFPVGTRIRFEMDAGASLALTPARDSLLIEVREL